MNLKNISKQLERAKALCRELDTQIKALKKERSTLERQGYTYDKLDWRHDRKKPILRLRKKYQKGVSRYETIGSDEAKIKEAVDRHNRGVRHQEVCSTLEQLEKRTSNIERAISKLIEVINGGEYHGY